MEIVTSDWKMADVILANHLLLPVIDRFDIALGFGDTTIKEVCRQNNVDTNFFLAIINTFHNEDYFPQKQLLSFSPLLIINYLKKTHNYYLEYVIPSIEVLLDGFLSGYKGKETDLKIIRRFYREYKQEIFSHINEEERIVFPYVLGLLTGSENPEAGSDDAGKSKYSISDFERGHSNIDEKILDLKNIIIKYLDPAYDTKQCHAFLNALFLFEEDLKDHARIEDKILVPKVREIEKALKNG